MASAQYSEPVSRLLSCGSLLEHTELIDYQGLGLSQEDIPALITMSADNDLHWADPESDEVWAPVHAWRALGQLRAAEAVPVLLEQLALLDDDDDEWAGEELPDVFGMIGEAAVQGLTGYVRNKQNSLMMRAVAASALAKIGIRFPETRETCIAVLEKELARFSQKDAELNGFLVSYLLDLQAVEALATIEVAYQRDCVDPTVCGDFEDVEIDLGVRDKRTKPRANLWAFDPPAGQVSKKKVGRNEPCPCGSGKKYKKCCLNK